VKAWKTSIRTIGAQVEIRTRYFSNSSQLRYVQSLSSNVKGIWLGTVEYARFGALMEVRIPIEVFWVAMPYSARFSGPCCLQFTHPESGDSMDLRNVGTLPQHSMGSETRRPRLESLYGGRGGNMDLWNVGILPQYYTASQHRRPRLE
jgi:hypothetical protein